MVNPDSNFGTGMPTSRRAFMMGIGGWLVTQIGQIPGITLENPGGVAQLIIDSYARLRADTMAPVAGQDDPARLLADARTAWSYFSEWKVLKRARIPSTAYMDGGSRRGYPLLTMWDVASLINGCISARLLGIVTEAELTAFGERIIAILGQSTTRYGKSGLPGLEIAAGSAQAIRQGFDSADTGRLLISLKLLDNMTRGSLNVERLVKRWDFRIAVLDGAIRNLNGRRPQRFDPNSYVRYYMQGYNLWGFDLPDPLQSLLPDYDGNNRAAYFAAAAELSRYGTEPLATELIEIGVNNETLFLADMLYAAQIGRFNETGKLTCVSEGNLDQAPWFSYQSCQFGLDGKNRWVIDTNKAENAALLKKKGEALRAVSTKGCFLWSAARPGVYSNMLLEYARQKAADNRLGFRSNIYEATGTATTCSDINSNGIILEVIAYILGGRRPLLEQTAAGPSATRA